MMEHFDVSQQDVSYHINQIYDDGEHTLHLAIRYVCNLLIFGYCIRERNCLPLYLIQKIMQIQRFLYIFLATVVTQIALAQGISRGTVVDKETHEPIVGATISDAKRSKPLTVTDTEGRFIIPNLNNS